MYSSIIQLFVSFVVLCLKQKCGIENKGHKVHETEFFVLFVPFVDQKLIWLKAPKPHVQVHRLGRDG